MRIFPSQPNKLISGRLWAALFVCLCLPAAVWAQQALGNITGTVQDSTGAVIPGAKITITNEQTGISTEVESRTDGTYTALNLVPGQYKITAELEGFKKFEITGLRLNVGSTLTQSIVLEVGVITESVEVSGQALQVQTTSGEVGSTIQVEQILELPMPNRNVFSLVNLTPGAFYKSGMVSLGGGRTQSALAELDGVQNSRGGLGVQNIEMAPPIDSMQEFKVELNAMGAQYGRSSAGVVNAVTKSGTNEFHGSLYEFVRNDKFDARGWSADEKPKLRRNNFGGTIGGPIIKNKSFFFFNLDRFDNRGAAVRTRSVGLPEFQEGDFSNATALINGKVQVVPIYDPYTGNGTFAKPKNTQPFPGNKIPASMFDPASARVLAGHYIPAPNRPPNNAYNNSGNWQENTPTKTLRNYYTIKLDHELNAKTRGYARFIFTEPDDSINSPSQGYGVADYNQSAILNNRQNLALNVTHLFSPTFILNATAGYGRVTINRKTGDCCDTNYAEKFGIGEVSRVGGEVFPRLNWQGGLVPMSQIGATGNAHRFAAFNNFDYDLQFTKMQGSHTLKFGFKHQRFQGNELSRPQPSGNWRFTDRWTKGYNAKGKTIKNTGIAFASFLLGRLNSVDARVAPTIGKRIRYYGGYFQDDWKVTRNLTVNIGIRYEAETPITEVGDRLNGFSMWAPNPLAGQNGIPEDAIGAVTFPNRNGVGKYLWKYDKNNWGPRFGFAWRIFGTDNTVLRGGAGLFYGNPYDRNAIQVARAGFDMIFKARHPVPFTFSEGIPAGSLDDIPESELKPWFGMRGTRFHTSSIQFFDENRSTPYTENFNITLQHQWKGWFFEVGALGNLGRQTPYPNINLNHIRPEDLHLLGEGVPELSLRPWQCFDSNMPQIQIMAPNWGISNAWLGTLKVERRYQNGFGITLAYTFTSWIDTIRFTGGGNATWGDNDQVQNIYDMKHERAKSTNSIPHRLVIAPIWDLPFGHGRKWGNDWNPVLDGIIGGWQLSTIGTLRSGAPFGVNVLNGPIDIRGDASDGTNLRPNLVQGVSMYDSRKGQPLEGDVRGRYWLNPDAFAYPDMYTLGNASRTLPGVHGPGHISFDLMVAKNWHFLERYRLQFRWEMFNFTNTPQWGLPNQSFGSSNFGWLTGAGGRRIMQFGMKLYF